MILQIKDSGSLGAGKEKRTGDGRATGRLWRLVVMVLVVLVLVGQGFSESLRSVGFTEHKISYSHFQSPIDVHSVDLDGDGDTDILSVNSTDHTVSFCENDGDGNFVMHTIATSINSPKSVYAADLNGDGDMDVLTVSEWEDKVIWLENNGTKTFTPHVITTDADHVQSVYAEDIDGDGDMDVLSASLSDDKIAWYENNGSGSFTTHLIAIKAKGASSVYAADVDNDGHMDVLSASLYDDKIVWYENDGQERFTPRTISSTADAARSVFSADLDGDGDMDVLSASANDDKIAWYENSGGSFSSHTIANDADRAHTVHAVDIDNDGDMDVLSSSLGDDKIAWYENDGSGIFTSHTITTDAAAAFSVHAADFDSDGVMDVVSASTTDNKVAWYKGDGDGGFTTKVLGESISAPFSVFSADIDGDGDADVLTTGSHSDQIVWFENRTGNTFICHEISATGEYAADVFAADLDNDGDMDVLSASSFDNKIAWHENSGSGTFTTHIITSDAEFAEEVYAADLDGDGDMDVLSASSRDDKVAWYRNNGNKTFTANTISSNADGAISVYAADINGDGDIDVLSASKEDGKISWYENSGNGSFTEHIVTMEIDGPRSVYAADLNNDGHMDLLCASYGDSTIAWYESAGDGSFTNHVIANQVAGARRVFAVDLDKDGDTDVLSASSHDNKITWYDNRGEGTFVPFTISDSALGAYAVCTADIDGDGTLDVLSASVTDSKIAWYTNGLAGGTLSPKEGEMLHSDSVYTIQWSWGGDNSINLSYSLNKGTDWEEIALSIPNDGFYNWTVPSLQSNQCLIRIGDAVTGDWIDTSGLFTMETSYEINRQVKISAGGEHSVMLHKDSTLWAWGRNHFGELGDGTNTNKNTPTKIGNKKYHSVSAGDNYTVAIAADSTLWAWGKNSNGQLGDGTNINKNTPTKIGDKKYTSVSASYTHTAALAADSTLWIWGDNYYGQLGDGTTIGKNTPTKIGDKKYLAVSVGDHHTVALAADSTLWTWGYNGRGQLGDGTNTNKNTPTKIGNSKYLSVNTGDFHTVVLAADSTLWAWGSNVRYQLGDGTSEDKDIPVKIGNSKYLSVSAGQYHTVALAADSALWAWGSNVYGQLGDGTTWTKSTPTKIGNKKYVSVSAGGDHTVAIEENSLLWTWGNNYYGQLGDGTSTDKFIPVKIGNSKYLSVSAGQFYSVALAADSTLWAWGSNGFGQLGDETTIDKSIPVKIGNKKYLSVSAGAFHSTALAADSTLWAWGHNNRGQLGDGTTIDKDIPVKIGNKKYLSVSAGGSYTVALAADSTLWAWGSNVRDELGDGTSEDKDIPVKIGNKKYLSVSAGGSHTVAIAVDSSLWIWGYNHYGQLGDGTSTNKSIPVKIGNSKYLSVSAGQYHTVALAADSTLWAWGYNNLGQLGDGTTIDKDIPVKIGNKKYLSVSAGQYHTVALAADSALWAWGHNYRGQLGDGTLTEKSIPMKIGNEKYLLVSAGGSHTLALEADSTLWSWGYNYYGQLGDGAKQYVAEPISICSILVSSNNLIVGSEDTIRIIGLSPNRIEYSVNGGSDWTTLGSASDGTYIWEIPNLISSQCYVRLLDKDGVPQDTSDLFAIVNGIIEITSPQNGESFVGATTHDITWDGQGAIGTVKIEYTTDGTNWETIATGETNDGTYSWTIPDKNSTTCKIRVTSELNPEVTDMSDANFIITPTPKITLTAPNGTESWIYGTTQEITWTNVNLQDQVFIEYSSDSGENWHTIATVTSGATTGTYNWTIPNNISEKCLVRVSEAGDKIPTDVSDAAFAIALPTVAMTSPNGGEVLYKGDAHTITWTSVGTVGDVKLEFTSNGISWSPISLGTANDGSYSWTAPDIESEKCKIRISEVSNSAIVDKSDADFTITTTPQITLTAPNGGQAWTEGTVEDISWITAGAVGKIKIDYTKNGIDWTVIVDSTENDGLFNWDIPRDPTTTCKIRVTDISNTTVTDMSDANMTLRVKPALAVTAPVGGEEWEVGSSQTIRWTTEGIVGNVKIEYSVDSGTNWKLISPSTVNDGSETWTVADDASVNCLIRVYEMGDGDPADTCTDVFEIFSPTITLLNPNGGETLNVGNLHTIEWESRGTVGKVNIDFRDTTNGNWIEVIKGVSNNGGYNWTVPDSGTTTGRIRISEVTRPSLFDISDNQFTIDGGSLTITKQPISKSVEAGDDATFTVTAVGKKPISYEWRKDGVALSGETAATLTLSSVTLADSGKYTCFVSNPFGNKVSDEAKLTVGNKAPVLTKADNQTTAEDTPITLTVAMTDATDDDPLTLVVGTGDNYSVDGTKVTPAENWHGTLTVPVSVTDGKLTSAIVNMTITVTPVNDIPIITSTPGLKAVEQRPWSYTVVASDVETATLVYSLSGEPTGMTITDNVLSWTPAENVTTSGEVTLSVSDDHTPAGTIEQKFTITVSDSNMAPILTKAITQTTAEDTPLTLTVAMTDGADGDGDALNLIVEPGTNYTVDGAKITPAVNFFGELSVPVTVTDGLLSSGTVTMKVMVTPVNDAPVLTKTIDQTTNEEQSITITLAMLEASDVDGDALTIILENPSGCTIDGTTLIPDKDNNFEIAVSVSVSDGELTSNSKFMIISVKDINDAPVLTTATAQTVVEDTPLELTLEMTNAGDVDGNVLTLVVGEGDNYSTTGTTITPALNFVGDLTVPLSVSDGALSSATVNMTVTVTPVNDAPVLQAVAKQTMTEDVPFTLTLDMVTAIDVDGDALTLVPCEGPDYSIVGNTITPLIHHVGEIIVPVFVSDGALLSDTLDMKIWITPVNDVPTLTKVTPQTTAEDKALVMTLAMTDAYDDDMNDLTLIIGAGANYTVAGTTVTPVANFVGTLSVPVSVTDGTLSSAVVNATITVTPVNDAPSLTVATAQTVAEDTPLTVTLAMTDAQDVDGDALTLLVGTGDNFTVEGATITPVANYNGVLSVPLYVTDGDLSSAVVPLSITVTAVNDAPTLTAATAQTTLENTPLALTVAMTDAQDVDGDALTLIVGPGENYTVEGTTITPALNFAGNLTVLLAVTDSKGISAIVPMTVTVTSTNVAPVLHSVAPLAMMQNTPVTLTANSFVAEDADGDPLTLIIEPDVNATVSGMTITPVTDFVGTMKLVYSVTDGRNISNKLEQAVVVKATGTNTPPVLEAVTITEIEKNSTVTFSMAQVTGHDADGDILQIIIGEGENYTVNGATLTPAPDYLGNILVPVTLSDGIAHSQTMTCTIDVYEEVFGFHKGKLEKSTITKVAITPNPVPASSREVVIVSDKKGYDRLEVAIYDHVGNEMLSTDAIDKGRYFRLEWDVSTYGGTVGGAFVAIFTYYKDGAVVSQRKEMIGIVK